MSENKSPAFQFYGQDFLMGTLDFSAEEVGGYIRLLVHQWDKGSLPNDDKILMKLSGMRLKALETVKKKFVLADGCLKNARLEKTRAQQKEYRERQKRNGSKGGRPVKSETQTEPTDNPLVISGETQTKPLHSSSLSSSSIVHQQQHAHEVFGKKLLTEEMELDRTNIELQLNPRRLITETDIEEFNRHLQTEGKNHVHRSEYLKHLRNWLNKKPNHQSKIKSHGTGSQNTGNKKIGRIDTGEVSEYLNRREDKGNSHEDNTSEVRA